MAFKQFYLIGITCFLRTFVGTFIGTGMPVFILENWNSNLFSGLSLASLSLTYTFSAILFGGLSDKIGRRKSVIISLVGNFASTVGFCIVLVFVKQGATMTLLVVILLLRANEGLFNGFFWPVLQSSIPEISIKHAGEGDPVKVEATTKQGISIFNVGWNSGILAGGLALSTLLFFDLLDVALVAPAILNGGNLVLLIVFMREPVENRKEQRNRAMAVRKQAQEDPSPEAERHRVKSRKTRLSTIILGIGIICVFALQMGGYTTTITNYFKSVHQEEWLGVLDALRLTFQLVGSSKLLLPSKHRQVQLALISCGIAGLGIIMALAVPSIVTWPFFILFPVLGLLLGMVYAACIELVSSSAAEDKRGTMMGFFEASIGIGFFVGPTVAGIITDSITYMLSFLFIGVLTSGMALSCYGIYLLVKRVKMAKPT